MTFVRILGIATVALAAFFFSAACEGQSETDSSSVPYPTRPLPPAERITPFSDGATPAADAQLIEFLTEDKIAEPDRSLAASDDNSIREHATLAGFDFDKGTWSHEQLVCQALPDYLLLVYRGDNGGSDVSLFSAAISRGDKTRVRVIPIQRRGYSLYSPAPVNALAISLFNRVRANDPASKTADWLSTALCYAALTGAHPETAPLAGETKDGAPSLRFPPTIEVGSLGESTVRFVDIATKGQPMEWALSFDSKGHLQKVVRFATPAYVVKPIPLTPEQPGRAQSSK